VNRRGRGDNDSGGALIGESQIQSLLSAEGASGIPGCSHFLALDSLVVEEFLKIGHHSKITAESANHELPFSQYN
jgi:hypothetical protein